MTLTSDTPTMPRGTTDEDAYQVATTILNQIGTEALLAVSARDAIATNDDGSPGVLCRFGKAHGNKRYLGVTLTPWDTYTVAAWEYGVRSRTTKLNETHEDIYFDMLTDLVREINQRYF